MAHPSHIPPITMPDLVDYILSLRRSGWPSPAILSFCFSDELALKACLEACKEARSIPVIMATINQVNSDGGYSGLTSSDFVRRVRELAHETGYDGPIILGRDHGGPYIVPAQKTLSRSDVMTWVKHNVTEDLKAGFTCWHADGTSGVDDEKKDGQLPVELVAETTVEMIAHCESERKRLGIAPISYEIGSEEQLGGLTSSKKFDEFLKLITGKHHAYDLTSARIDFVVAQTGTHMKLELRKPDKKYRLYQDGFKPDMVKKLDHVAQKYRTPQQQLLFTQHYSDRISPADIKNLLALHIGKVNFGPEMTMPELGMLLSWEKEERKKLDEHNRIAHASNFRQVMIKELDRHLEFWHDYLPFDRQHTPGESLSLYNHRIQDAIIIFRGRYVKTTPACAWAAEKLLKNIVELGIHTNPAAAVVEEIKTKYALPRIRQLRMEGILDNLLACLRT